MKTLFIHVNNTKAKASVAVPIEIIRLASDESGYWLINMESKEKLPLTMKAYNEILNILKDWDCLLSIKM